MSPSAITANANETYEDVIPAMWVVEIRCDSNEPFEDLLPQIKTAEVSA